MIPMKTLTIKGKTYEIIDDHARKSITAQREDIRRSCSTAIVQTVEGSPIVVQDSSDNQLLGLRLFGKTTQDSVPDVFEPQKLRHVASRGSIKVRSEGLNLIDMRLFSIYANTNSSRSRDGYTVSVTGGAVNAYTSSTISLTHLVDTLRGKKVYFAHDSMTCTKPNVNCGPQLNIKRPEYTDYIPLSSSITKQEIVIPADVIDITVGIYTNNTGFAITEDNTVVVNGLRLSLFDSEWSENSSTEMTVSVPSNLPGIPVASGGNYIDEDGIQWLCDEVDLERGVYIQRVRQIDNEELNVTWSKSIRDNDNNYMYHVAIDSKYPIGYGECLCNRLVRKQMTYIQSDGILPDTVGLTASPKYNVIYVNIGRHLTENTSSAMSAFFDAYPLTIVYGLAKPIETPLSDAELTAYKELYSVYPSSTFNNDHNAYMEVTYNADTKLYLESCYRPTDEQVQAAVNNWLSSNFTMAEGVSF